MDPFSATQPIQGGFGYSYGGYGSFSSFGSFGAAAARTGCCDQMPAPTMPPMACCPTTGAVPGATQGNPNKAMQKSLKRIEKTTAKLLKLLMRLMEGKKPKKAGKGNND